MCVYDGINVDTLPQDLEKFRFSIQGPSSVRIGFSDPKSDTGVGQLINHASSFSFDDSLRDENGFFRTSSKSVITSITNYTNTSQQGANVTFGDEHFNICATRDIKKGEELFIHYGIDYWLTLATLTTDEPFTRVSCQLIQKNWCLTPTGLFVMSQPVAQISARLPSSPRSASHLTGLLFAHWVSMACLHLNSLCASAIAYFNYRTIGTRFSHYCVQTRSLISQ